jgi:phosphatidate cytidylyltransferase
MSELTKRIIVAIMGIPAIVVLTYLGGWYFFALISIISMVALWEFYTMQKKQDQKPQVVTGIAAGLLILIGFQTGEWILIGNLLILLVIGILLYEMLQANEKASINIGITIVGVVYIPFFMAMLLSTRNFLDQSLPDTIQAGFTFVMILLVTIWICDTLAYSVGSALGKHKLYEKVSPNKTWEGAVAGLLSAVLTIVCVKLLNLLPLDWFKSIILGLTIGTIGQLGDLVESWFKRNTGVKDSSSLLPGHGGMLDRFDSLIFLSPAMFILMHLFFNYR